MEALMQQLLGQVEGSSSRAGARATPAGEQNSQSQPPGFMDQLLSLLGEHGELSELLEEARAGEDSPMAQLLLSLMVNHGETGEMGMQELLAREALEDGPEQLLGQAMESGGSPEDNLKLDQAWPLLMQLEANNFPGAMALEPESLEQKLAQLPGGELAQLLAGWKEAPGEAGASGNQDGLWSLLQEAGLDTRDLEAALEGKMPAEGNPAGEENPPWQLLQQLAQGLPFLDGTGAETDASASGKSDVEDWTQVLRQLAQATGGESEARENLEALLRAQQGPANQALAVEESLGEQRRQALTSYLSETWSQGWGQRPGEGVSLQSQLQELASQWQEGLGGQNPGNWSPGSNAGQDAGDMAWQRLLALAGLDQGQTQAEASSLRDFEGALQRLEAQPAAAMEQTAEATRLEDIVARAHLAQKQGETQLDMQLKPEVLGRLRIEMVQREGELEARFITTTQEAKALLESQLPQLRALLAQPQAAAGENPQDVSVTVDLHDAGDAEQEQFAGEYRQSGFGPGEEAGEEPGEEPGDESGGLPQDPALGSLDVTV